MLNKRNESRLEPRADSENGTELKREASTLMSNSRIINPNVLNRSGPPQENLGSCGERMETCWDALSKIQDSRWIVSSSKAHKKQRISIEAFEPNFKDSAKNEAFVIRTIVKPSFRHSRRSLLLPSPPPSENTSSKAYKLRRSTLKPSKELGTSNRTKLSDFDCFNSPQMKVEQKQKNIEPRAMEGSSCKKPAQFRTYKQPVSIQFLVNNIK